MRAWKAFTLVGPLLAGCLAVTACGGHGEEAPGGPRPLQAYPPAQPLTLRDLDPPDFWQGSRAGLWSRAPESTPEPSAQDLRGIGYAQGFQRAPAEVGVAVHDRARVQAGPTLYVSGHAAEAFLIDQDGNELHRWSFPYERIPNAPTTARPQQSGCWRRARVLPDGTLYAIHEGVGLVALDRDSHLLWFRADGEHHDLEVQPDGTLVVLARDARVVPSVHPGYQVLEDLVLWISPQGKELRRLSLIDCWQRSQYSAIFDQRPYPVGDITHTNSITVLDDRLAAAGPAFAPGNLLISSRMLDAIAVVDPERRQVRWARHGPWIRQHDATATPSGTILLFDNKGYRGHSQVLEFDPARSTEVWSYRGKPPSAFDCIFCGAAQRLDNGNTLITDTCAGHAFEVTPENEVVWEFHNPHRTGEGDELVAALFDCVRMPVGFGQGWGQ